MGSEVEGGRQREEQINILGMAAFPLPGSTVAA